MKLAVTLVGVLLYLTTVKGNESNDDAEGLSNERVLDNIRIARELGANEMRHRRKRWHSNYGYNYQHYNYPDDRRDSEQDTLSQIMRLLDEISDYVRRPSPPPPQPVYIPYPMPYPVPQYCNCRSNSPNLTERFPIMDDTNQNWGFVDQGDNQKYDVNNNKRPVSFDPIIPIRSSTTRPRPVEHGSSQAGLNSNSVASPPTVSPTQCDAAILSCCGPTRSKTQQRRCFATLGCDSTYANGNGCSANSISAVLDLYKNAYAATN